MKQPAPGTDLFKDRPILLALLGLYLLLALAYGLVNPLFEAPDEHWHYFTAQYVADNGRLPQVSDPPDEWLGQEAAQPPLYYVLGSLLVRLVDTEGARQLVWPNPLVHLGDASAPNNLNAFVHGPWEQWPWHGYALAAHLLRALSTLLGLGTLLFIYGSGRIVWPDRPRRALLATGLVAFLPQFLFIHSAVSNDSLIALLSAATLWQLLRLWRGPLARGRLLLLGVTIGLAILSKTAGLLLLAYAVGVLLFRTLWRRRQLWPVARDLFIFLLVPAALLGGWLLWRNWTLYGDVTAAGQFVRIAGGDRSFTLAQVLAETPGLWTSLFALFGWFNVRAPGWVYWVWNALLLLALAGAAIAALRQVGKWNGLHTAAGPGNGARQDGATQAAGFVVAAWLALWVLLVYAGLLAFMLRTPAAQGRLLFPALLPLALGAAFGMDCLHRRSWGVALPLALVTALYCLLIVIPHAYARPPLLEGDTLPDEARGEPVSMEQGLSFLGYSLEKTAFNPGEVAWLTLYWQAEESPLQAPMLVVELLGRQETLVGKYQGYHGGGLYPASLWPPGKIVADRIGLRLDEDMRVPVEIRVQAGLVGSLERHTIASFKAVPAQWPEAPRPPVAQLGKGIQLMEASLQPAQGEPGQRVAVTLAWLATQDVQGAYTTFVHLGDPQRPPLAQGDGPPLQGDYPTSWWEAGEVILQDVYAFTLPEEIAPGRYPLQVGLYDPQSAQRLPLSVAGERQAHDAYRVGWVTVE